MRVNSSQVRFAAGMLLTGFLLCACAKELSTEQQIIATLESMEAAAEEGRHLDFMGYVADDFSGQSGAMDRREFHRFMIFQMNENRRLQAQFFPIHVQEHNDTDSLIQASAQFKMLVTGGGGLLPERGQLFSVETEWIRDGSDWLLRTAVWEPADMASVYRN